MQVTKGTWRMREQCVPGSLSSPAREPGNEAKLHVEDKAIIQLGSYQNKLQLSLKVYLCHDAAVIVHAAWCMFTVTAHYVVLLHTVQRQWN